MGFFKTPQPSADRSRLMGMYLSGANRPSATGLQSHLLGNGITAGCRKHDGGSDQNPAERIAGLRMTVTQWEKGLGEDLAKKTLNPIDMAAGVSYFFRCNRAVKKSKIISP